MPRQARIATKRARLTGAPATLAAAATAAGLDLRCAWKAPLTPFVLTLPAT